VHCGAGLAAGAAWCGQCFRPAGSTGEVPAPAGGFRPAAASPLPMPASRTTRWRKTSTTFGPIGRLVASLALVVPFVFFVVTGFFDPIAWGGAVVWGGILMPWGLRDVWKAGRLQLG
jgi:hypothetical protein